MEDSFHIDHLLHYFGLGDVSRDAVEHENVDVWFEFVGFDRGIDCFLPELDRDLVRHELPFAGVIEECFADFAACVNGAKHVATSGMIKAGDRAERFALCALAAARCAEKNKGVVFHGDTLVIPQKPAILQALSSPTESSDLGITKVSPRDSSNRTSSGVGKR